MIERWKKASMEGEGMFDSSQSQPVSAPKRAGGQHSAIVERVREALRPWLNCSEEREIKAAVKAIEAMREPTDDLADAGHSEMCLVEHEPCVTACRRMWAEMIDAALNPEGAET